MCCMDNEAFVRKDLDSGVISGRGHQGVVACCACVVSSRD